MAPLARLVLLALLSLGHLVSGLPSAARRADHGGCVVKSQRKAWQNLTSAEKSDYIKATLCLQKAPAKAGIPGALTRWDELQYTHIVQSDYIHAVGAFLPWHRYFLRVHEQLLRNECGYRGAMPYWDEVRDAANISASVLFDAATGFGGNGVGAAGRCIADGPFTGLRLRYDEQLNVVDGGYCLSRNANQCFFASGSGHSRDETCMAVDSFVGMWHCLESRPHGAGHGGVGGIMVNVRLSPGDPLFWLHHTWLDRLWWQWQSQKLPDRLSEIGGSNMPPPLADAPALGLGPPPECLAELFNSTDPSNSPLTGTSPGNGSFAQVPFRENPAFTAYFGDGGGNTTTLGHTLWSAGLFPNATAADVMDVGGPLVCAEYL